MEREEKLYPCLWTDRQIEEENIPTKIARVCMIYLDILETNIEKAFPPCIET